MPTLFESLSDGFYTAFFEPNPEKRKEKINAWIKDSTPVIQSAVENDLRTYLEQILEGTWTDKGWKNRVEKFTGTTSSFVRKKEQIAFIDAYRLCLDVQIRRRNSKDKDIIGDVLTPEVRNKTNEAIEVAKIAIVKREPPPPITLREIDLHGNTVEEAIPSTEQFITECYRDNVRRIRIIHGKGIFVLQKAIREYLKNQRLVEPKSISPADKDHGGEGATEANLVEFSIDKLD